MILHIRFKLLSSSRSIFTMQYSTEITNGGIGNKSWIKFKYVFLRLESVCVKLGTNRENLVTMDTIELYEYSVVRPSVLPCWKGKAGWTVDVGWTDRLPELSLRTCYLKSKTMVTLRTVASHFVLLMTLNFVSMEQVRKLISILSVPLCYMGHDRIDRTVSLNSFCLFV